MVMKEALLKIPSSYSKIILVTIPILMLMLIVSITES